MAVDREAHRVDQHHTADPRAVAQRDLRGDPATDRVADDRDVGEVELVEERGVDRGQALHAVHAGRARAAVETGMNRHEYAGGPGNGEQIGEPGDGLWPCSTVQQEERVPAAVVVDLDGDRADALDGDGYGHQ